MVSDDVYRIVHLRGIFPVFVAIGGAMPTLIPLRGALAAYLAIN